ncbi:zinc ribbon domain-containing protein, partial [Streptomyces sp. NRRL F-4428]|uniref:zinc ribbon domain-containing protein n=1 Tax=Streptomyces sp. NRRL F-4428 TaxID=1609137 RepID=UPI003B63617D
RTPPPPPSPGGRRHFDDTPQRAARQASANNSCAGTGPSRRRNGISGLTILHAKAESAGREVIAVDPRNTSRTCPDCGHVAAENRPTQEKFHCAGCGHQAHADHVGALNVLRAGLARRQEQA